MALLVEVGFESRFVDEKLLFGCRLHGNMLKNPLLVHGAWFVVATTAFFLGYQKFPAPGGGVADVRAAGSTEAVPLGATLVRQSGEDSNGRARSSIAEKAHLLEGDIESLGEAFRKSASPIKRRLAFSRLLEGLTAENALLVREQIAHMDHRSAEFREFHYAWGAVGGAEAALFGATTKEDDMSPALAGWASADPSAALAWFDGLKIEGNPDFEYLLKDRKVNPKGLRDHLMRGLVQGLADKDPTIASKFVQEIAESGNKGAPRMMHTIAEAVMRTDKPSEATRWAETLPEGPLRHVAMSRVADRFVDEDPQAAAEWATNYASEPEGRSVIGEVGANWSHRDPVAALEWLTELPESHGQNNGMHRALRDWTHRDPAAASEYLSSMPDSPAKNSAITGFSSRIAHEDPQAAIAWAETISSEGQRNETMIAVGRAWARKDSSAAAAWAVASGLPENVQQAILNPPKDKRSR